MFETAELGRAILGCQSLGTAFTGKVVGDGEVAGIHGVVTEIRGSAFATGTAVFTLDPKDPIGLGFQLR